MSDNKTTKEERKIIDDFKASVKVFGHNIDDWTDEEILYAAREAGLVFAQHGVKAIEAVNSFYDAFKLGPLADDK
jgi:sulfur relay (sulfurtransferase) DsrC/TusE family protein